MEFDNVLRVVGEFGSYQKKLMVLLNLSIVPAAFQMMLLVFVGAEPEWICSPSQKNNSCPSNKSLCEVRTYTSQFTSIATEWDLVCEVSYKTDLAQSIFMGGTLVGGLLFGYLADRYGRKNVWYFSFLCVITLGLISSFATTYNLHTGIRFLTGMFTGGVILTSFVLMTELIGNSHRGFCGTLAPCFFTLGLMLLAITAYLVRDWRKLSIALSLPGFILLLFYSYIPESARWLMIRGRVGEAEDVLSRIAMKNGMSIPKTLLQINRPLQLSTSRFGCFELFSNRHMAVRMLILIYLWFVNSCVYYGLSLNTKNLGGDLYSNFFLSAIVELPAYFLSTCMINRVGRKKITFNFMILSGISCISCFCIQIVGSGKICSILITVSAMVGKFGISASFAVIYIYAAELLPTVVRNIGMGVCSMSARIGGVTSPFIVLLGTVSQPLPMLVFSVFSFTAALVTLWLPETLHKPLPETIEDEMDTELFGDLPYEQVEMEHIALVGSSETFFSLDQSDIEDQDEMDHVTEKTTFI